MNEVARHIATAVREKNANAGEDVRRKQALEAAAVTLGRQAYRAFDATLATTILAYNAAVERPDQLEFEAGHQVSLSKNGVRKLSADVESDTFKVRFLNTSSAAHIASFKIFPHKRNHLDWTFQEQHDKTELHFDSPKEYDSLDDFVEAVLRQVVLS
ncbi:MAG TPA: hypothetical protein VH250_05270 [Granulicella sp.]|nr:hypothetical protein [Granulicella sp.]